jgi:SAM-dependent methyltransferase
LPFTDDAFDLVFTTLSLRHRTDLSAGIAETGRVLTPGGLLVLAEVFPSRRRGPALPMLRRRHAAPAELGTVLAAHRLAVIGSDHIPWFSLPDVQVIGARQPHPRMRTHLPAAPERIPIRSVKTACSGGRKRQRQGGYALLATLNV